MEDKELTPADIIAYKNAVKICEKIFISRKEDYGDHLIKATRYINYNQCALYIKAVRVIEDFDNDVPKGIKRDTLIDLANYALMELSTQLNL